MKQYELLDDGTLIINDGVEIISSDFVDYNEKNKVKKVIMPNSVKELGANAFYGFLELEEIKLSESLKHIGNSAFLYCGNLKSINFPDGLKSIGEYVFTDCIKLKEIIVPDSVEYIGKSAFTLCRGLEHVELSNNIKIIEDGCFCDCWDLKEIHIPNQVKEIGEGAFSGCFSLSEVTLPNGLEFVGKRAFARCDELERVEFPNTLKKLANNSIERCAKLKEVTCPITAEIDGSFTVFTDSAENINFMLGNEKYTPNDIANRSVTSDGFTIVLNDDKVIIVGREQYNSIITTKKDFFIKANKWNNLEELYANDYFKLLDWNEYNFVPDVVVVENMPKDEIPLFYKDNNAKNWAEIVNVANFNSHYSKTALFCISQALGVFSPDGKESEMAKEYIIENIIKKYEEVQVLNMFAELKTYNVPYNKEFAKFFMLYFKENPNFLVVEDGRYKQNLLYKCHQDFKKIQEIFYNKKVVTRNDYERLTVDLVKNVVNVTEYNNVNQKAMNFANTLRKYGVSPNEYNVLQEWYLQGIDIPKDKITLKIQQDKYLKSDVEPEMVEENEEPTIVEEIEEPEMVEDDFVITYELLDKTDPLGAIIGDITNCCQQVFKKGSDCVKYGMTMPNSSFLAFRRGNRIIGQAWVWYNEETGEIALDNIEVPHMYLDEIANNKQYEKGFVDCLIRVKKGFENAMGKDKIKQVTVGTAHNDIENILERNFHLTKDVTYLSDYNGYSDARDTRILLADKSKKMQIENMQLQEKERSF